MNGVDPRLLQANERTMLAWIRTGLAMVAFGVVLARMDDWVGAPSAERAPTRWPLWAGIALVALGSSCHAIAAVRFVRVHRALLEGRVVRTSTIAPVLLALTLVVLGGVLVVRLLTG